MIKNILYVEDGSVDVEDLGQTLGCETKIIVYRQGSNPPILEQPKIPIITHQEIEQVVLDLQDVEDLVYRCYSNQVPFREDLSRKLRNAIKTLKGVEERQ